MANVFTPISRLGFSYVTPAGVARQQQLASEGKLWYVYPDSGVSQWSGAGAEGPFTLEEAQRRQTTIRSSQSAVSQTAAQPAPMPVSQPVATVQSPAPATVTTTAQNLANATKPTVPQFIQPYGRPMGFGAYGEKDINW